MSNQASDGNSEDHQDSESKDSDNDRKPFAMPKSPPRKKKEKSNRRPLSAYNLFFKEERARILQELEEDRLKPDYIANAEAARKRVKNGSKAAIKFQAIASTIAGRWKLLNEKERVPYEELAAKEMERYKERKDEFHRNLVRECQMAGRAALTNKPSSPKDYTTEARPSLREDHSTFGQADDIKNESMLPPPRLTLPAIVNQGPMSNMPLHPNPFASTAMGHAPWNQSNEQSLPLALMMRQVEVEQEISRLQEVVIQLRRQRELVQSTGMAGTLPRDLTFGQTDMLAMHMQQEQVLRDVQQRASVSAISGATRQQEYPASSSLSMPGLLALAQSLREQSDTSENSQSEQKSADPNWRPFLG